MRMAELSTRSGVPIPTIRFYLRERLLAPGERTSPNQATYGEEHVRHLRLIRALVEVGGLPISAVRDVLAFIAAKDGELYATMGGVQYALTRPCEPGSGEIDATATDRVERLLADRGWQVRPQNPARRSLAQVIATLERLGQRDVLAGLDDYADAAEQLAEREVADLLERPTVEGIAEGVIAYGVLGDALLSALRRLAQEAVTTRALRSRGT